VRNTSLKLAAIAALSIVAAAAIAQTSSGTKWFVPKTAATPAAAPAPVAAPAQQQAAAETTQVGLPPLPAPPQVAPGASPPAAVIGVFDLNGVIRSSTAYLAVQNEMRTREARLNADAQKAQTEWAELKQNLVDQQKTLTADQFAARNAQITDRIAKDEANFKARDQRIQDAATYADDQIEQELNTIVGQVAQSHGMNIVLFQTAVVLNVREFDISAQVAQELNQVLPSVLVPPDGADVTAFARAHEAPPAGK